MNQNNGGCTQFNGYRGGFNPNASRGDDEMEEDMVEIVQFAKSVVSDTLTTPQWKSAMDDEYEALMKNNTWSLVPPQFGQNVVWKQVDI
ncbi:unnamed protein product [Citrullus colocynthis]|uniref:Uncharacterized protein n=1 Tax=Citrullus colocynthis TaxID=252529 RepID=A0ABP0Y024_9ROSI